MPHYLIQHTMQSTSGLSKDRYVNTFHVDGLLLAQSKLEEIAGHIKFFYGADSTHAIGKYIARHAKTEPATIKIFNFAFPEPRVPVYEELYVPENSNMGGTPLPDEVCSVLSYEAAPEAGIPMSRRRGRLYLGPLENNTVQTETNGPTRPNTAFQTAAVLSFGFLAAGITAIADVTFVQRSESSGAMAPPVRWWMDDAWDTQRRRGAQPTSRVVADISGVITS